MSTENRSLRLPRGSMRNQERGFKQSLSIRGIPLVALARIATAVLGGVLFATGLRRRSLLGAAVALAGGELLARSIGSQNAPARRFETETWQEGELSRESLQVVRAITIRRSAEELYRLWRDPRTQQRIMEPFAEVTLPDRDHVHWVMRGPLDLLLVWDTGVTEDRAGELLRWRSLPGAPLPYEGLMHFRPAPAGRGTEVILRLRFPRSSGSRGQTIDKLLGALPSGLALKALYRFKSLAETGEIPTVALQPACRRNGRDA